MNSVNPHTWQKRFDLWDSPGVEQYNFAYVTKIDPDDVTRMWDHNEDDVQQDMIERFRLHEGVIMFATIPLKGIDQSLGYERVLVFYSETEDWLVTDRLAHSDTQLAIQSTLSRPR